MIHITTVTYITDRRDKEHIGGLLQSQLLWESDLISIIFVGY